MPRILLVDDHSVVRAGLRQILEDELGDAEFGEAGTGNEALTLLKQGHWDALILDLSLPDRPGLDVLKVARESTPELPVLVLSIHPADQYGKRVLRAGAACYLTKESAPETLGKAVRAALDGEPESCEDAGAGESLSLPSLHDALSDREFQVVCLIATGHTVSGIADQLELSVNTVSTYRCRALEKMGMGNNAELTSYMIRHNLVS